MNAVLLLRCLAMALDSLITNKRKSILIICAVGQAVTALTIIVATMEGAERKAEQLAIKFGPTAVNILGTDVTGQSLGRGGMTLTWTDLRGLEAHLSDVERVSPYLYRVGVRVQGGGKTHFADSLCGSGEEHGLHWSWPLRQGRDFTPEDVRYARRVCFLGSITAETLFGGFDPIGEEVLVDGIPFTVIGVQSALGVVSDGVEIDDRVTVPVTTMAGRFDISRHHLFQIRATFPLNTPESSMPGKVEAVRGLLRDLHGLDETQSDDFILFTAQDVLAFISIVKGGVVLFLGVTVIAAVFVSGFILANLFHLSVAERSGEIGLKKALGAKRSAIVSQFLFEALLLCFGGAAAGLLAGLCISLVLERFGLLTIALSGFLFMAAFTGATGIALCFGLRPARQAANLPAVAALKERI